MRKTNIGGQAVLEGVMMRGPENTYMAVRRPKGNIEVVEVEDRRPPAKGVLSWPIIRGVVNFALTLKLGIKVQLDSAKLQDMDEEGEASRFELWLSKKLGKSVMDVMMSMALVLGVALAVGLFILLPTFLTQLVVGGVESSFGKNLIEGLIRMLVFLGYMVAVSLMRDIRRVFQYHGAEHKVISCYEHELPLTVENARKMSRLHPRCGTSFLFLVIFISILFFALLGYSGSWWERSLLRIACLPVVAGLSYEILKLSAKSDNLFVRIVRYPGMLLQRLTTKEPDDSMLEVSLASFNAALTGEVPDEYQESLADNDGGHEGDNGGAEMGGQDDSGPCDEAKAGGTVVQAGRTAVTAVLGDVPEADR